jgi:HEAT repeat protein
MTAAAERPDTAALLLALAQGDEAIREAAAHQLAQRADPASTEALAAALADPSPRVRCRAAQGLAALHDARALPVLIETIDTLPDLLMAPSTAATEALVRWGRGALPLLVPLLDARQPVTRQRAFLVLQAIVGANDALTRRELWQRLGAYDPLDTDAGRRSAAAAAWSSWVAMQHGTPR